MQHEIDISATFLAVRGLPLEVTLEQVEDWLHEQPAKQTHRPTWWARLRQWLTSS